MGNRADLRCEVPGGLSDVARPITRTERSEADFGSRFLTCSRVIARAGEGGKERNEHPPGGHMRQGMDYGEHADVHQVHSAIQREKREPRAGLEPLSIWLIAVYGLAIFFGGAYLGRFSGNFSGDSLDPAVVPQKKQGPSGPGGEQTQELSQADRGKKIFSANCAVCHQPNGLGAAGQGYPPLAGSEYVNGGTRRVGMIVLKGLQGPLTVKGQSFGAAVMQPWDKTLSDAKIADVLTY